MRNFTLILLVILGLVFATPTFAAGNDSVGGLDGDSSTFFMTWPGADWLAELWAGLWTTPNVDKDGDDGSSDGGSGDGSGDNSDPNDPGQEAAGGLAPNG